MKVERAGWYRVTLYAAEPFAQYSFRVGDASHENTLAKPARTVRVGNTGFVLKPGDARVEAWVGEGKNRRGVTHLELEYMGQPRKK